jgi:23S rRNA (cytosine1962-C5)-methyltransferase
MKIRLKAGKEKKIRNRYPWIFRDDVATHFKERQDIVDGSVVHVFDQEDRFLGLAFYNARSHIVARMLTRQNVPIDEVFWKRRLQQAIDYRRQLNIDSTGIRLVHSEADGCPGLMIDLFDSTAVVQFRSLGMDRYKPQIVQILKDIVSPAAIYERSDMESREEEGLEPAKGLLAGVLPTDIFIRERDLRFRIDVERGHKTGFYLDQRDNRALIGSLLRNGQRCLDLFSYVGAFAVAAAKAGADVIAVDSDPWAIEEAGRQVEKNDAQKKCSFIGADVFEFLEIEEKSVTSDPGRYRKFDLIVIDPPAIAKRKEGIDKLKWAYWKLLKSALPLLNSGGHVVLSSCAYHMPVELMHEAARFASADLGIRLRVAHVTYQPPDHPWMLQIPESLYLKTAVYQVV